MKLFRLFIIFFLFYLCFAPNLVHGQGVNISITNPLKYDTLDELVRGIINFIFWVATAAAPLMIVIGAFYFLTSAGNPQQVDTGKKIILYTLIGYAIIFVSYGLITVIKDILGGGTP